ncbi:MAG: hypothetical protein SH847_22610, partial [Roseiflexaceae bacterium]|nr:hypothetical protein [Roseiflexaceae bacterium]
YMAGQIAPLAATGGRELGVAIYQTTAIPLGPHLWVALIGPVLAMIVGGIAGLRGWRAITLFGYALLIYAREPRLFYEPRLWAEEGLIYFSYAATHEWWRVILAPQLGYYAMFANFAALLAAPFVTILLALVIQLLPAVLILWSDSPLWDGRLWRRVLALLALVVPISGEVWLNTINSQFHLALAAGIILAIPPARGTKGWLYAALLAFIGLSSPSACFLVPAFWLRWQKNKAGLADAIILTVALAIQGAIAFGSLANAELRGVGGSIALLDRAHPNYPPTIALILALRLVVTPVLGYIWTSELTQYVLVLWRSAGWMYEALAAVVCSVFGGGIIIAWRRDRRAVSHHLLVGIFLLAAGSTIVSLGATRIELLSPLTGSRYYYAPIALLFLVVASWVGSSRRIPLAILLAIVIGHSVVAYRATLPQAYDWSLWDLEVARWRIEPEYALKTWPRGWRMKIAPVHPLTIAPQQQ